MNDSDVIETAADIIEKRGWCAGNLMLSNGTVCVDGALAVALGLGVETAVFDDNISTDFIYENEGVNRIAGKIVVALGLESDVALPHCIATQYPASVLFRWNDDMGYGLTREQNKQRILDGLRKAAKIVRLKEENGNS